MRIPVILTLSSQQPLVESAAMASRATEEGLPPTSGIVPGTEVPAGFEIDPEFPAVPIGPGRRDTATLESLAPEASENFVVRGTVEVDHPDEVPSEIGGNPVFADPRMEPFLTCVGSAALGSTADVAANLDLAALHAEGLDGEGVAIAIFDTGINLAHLQSKLGSMPRIDAGNSWTPPGVVGTPFQHPLGHGTMCAFDALIAAPRATLLDFPGLLGTVPGGVAMGRRLSIAILGFAQLTAFWAVGFAPSGGPRYKALVVNNSWGMYHPSWDFAAGHPGRYSDNVNHPFNVLVSTLARANADIVFAAGNCGSQCPSTRCQSNVTDTITGANALPEVLTLAGCDMTDMRVGYSSQGPAIAGMHPEKPDLTAYTHFLGSESVGAGSPDSGTSTACPVAAGCVAALRTAAGASPDALPPAGLFAQLRATARQVQGAGWNADYGFGIIDPVAAGRSLGLVQ